MQSIKKVRNPRELKESLTYQEQDEKKMLKFKEDLEKLKEEQEEKLGHPPALVLVYVDESTIKEEVTRIHADGVLLHPRKEEGCIKERKGYKI